MILIINFKAGIIHIKELFLKFNAVIEIHETS
jgi:hypothetical protein